MKNNPFIKTNWKLILNIITIFALVLLIYFTRDQILSTIKNLAHIDAWALLLIIPLEILNYHAQTKLYQGLFRVAGNNLPYKYLFKIALELNFVNHVFPSGGVTGISYFGVRIKDKDLISGGKATLIQMMKLILTILSFEILLVIGVLSLAIFGKVDDLTILVAGVLSTILFGLTILFVYIVGSQSRIDHFFVFITKSINKLSYFIFRGKKESINILRVKKVFSDFHGSYKQLVSKIKELKKPFYYALLTNLTEILVIYVVYIAFGKFINIGAIIIAYGVANFAGLVSFLPGGIGIYEALMTVVLASAGIPPQLSLPVTIMYRVVNTVLQLPPGYFLYHKNLNISKKPEINL